MAVQTQIQVRRGTAATWTSTNPTLAAGEWGLETDTGKYKIGTGSAVWTSLGYASILPSTVTTKGDLLAASGNATVTRQAVGSDGYQLVADSSQTTGLGWAGNVAAGKNAVINGGFDIWQRGTSFAYSGSVAYSSDRWCGYNNGTSLTISRQATNDTTNLPNIQYCARVQRNSGSTNVNLNAIEQSLETVNSIPFSGKTVTFSFYARAGANYSPTSSALNVILSSSTGTDQNWLSSWTGESVVINQNATLTTTWQRFSYTATVPTTSTQLATIFRAYPTGTAGAADYYEITGVQLELGSSATPFSRTGGTIQGELAACQRYYYLHASGSGKAIGMGANTTATEAYTALTFPVTMRTAPTLVVATGTGYYRFYRNGASDDFDSFTIEFSTTTAAFLYNATEISGTAGQAGTMRANNASASIAFNAEL